MLDTICSFRAPETAPSKRFHAVSAENFTSPETTSSCRGLPRRRQAPAWSHLAGVLHGLTSAVAGAWVARIPCTLTCVAGPLVAVVHFRAGPGCVHKSGALATGARHAQEDPTVLAERAPRDHPSQTFQNQPHGAAAPRVFRRSTAKAKAPPLRDHGTPHPPLKSGGSKASGDARAPAGEARGG